MISNQERATVAPIEAEGLTFIPRFCSLGKTVLGTPMGFREHLPDGCPPAEAHEDGCEQAYRFIPKNPPVAADFDSNSAKGEPLPEGLDPCRWAACSLFTDMETVQTKRKLRKLRQYPFVAQLRIAPTSGRIVQDRKHISFWMFDTFDPVAAVVHIQRL